MKMDIFAMIETVSMLINHTHAMRGLFTNDL